MDTYELIIIGSGPAGLTASIYASRYKLNHLILGGKQPGGEMALSPRIDNYPSYISINGAELTQKMMEQVNNLGIIPKEEMVTKIGQQQTEEINQKYFDVATDSNNMYHTQAVIIATGTERRKLKVPGEQKYGGKGVSYCTTCDAPLFKQKKVCVVGGSNPAAEAALHLSEFAQTVYIINRFDSLTAEANLAQRIEEKPNITFVFENSIKEILGDGNKITSVSLNSPYNGSNTLMVDGVFVEIGSVPGTSLVNPLGVKLDENGFIQTSLKMETNVPGLFAAGDITSSGSILQQIVTSSAQGAMAAASAYFFVRNKIAPPLR